LMEIDGKPYCVISIDAAEDKLQSIYVVLNPQKLSAARVSNPVPVIRRTDEADRRSQPS
jgi:hypothetical protein